MNVTRMRITVPVNLPSKKNVTTKKTPMSFKKTLESHHLSPFMIHNEDFSVENVNSVSHPSQLWYVRLSIIFFQYSTNHDEILILVMCVCFCLHLSNSVFFFSVMFTKTLPKGRHRISFFSVCLVLFSFLFCLFVFLSFFVFFLPPFSRQLFMLE